MLNDADECMKTCNLMKKNGQYKWQKLDKKQKFSLRIDSTCDVCTKYEGREKPVLQDLNIYLEPKCGHELHQNCRSRFSRACWDFAGHSDGYQLSDCPICYTEKNHGMGYKYYANQTDGKKSSKKSIKYYSCMCEYFLDGNGLETLIKKKL